jgi:aspartokinase/homoserine dehydrogenase 1
VKKIEVHAIESTMIVEKGSERKFRELITSSKATHHLFVISPVSLDSLELKDLLDAAKAHDERLWSMMETHTSEWISLIEKRVSPSHQSAVLSEIKNGFNAVEDLLRAIWLVGDISHGSVKYIDTLLSRFSALLLRELLIDEDIDTTISGVSELLGKKETLLDRYNTIIVSGELEQSTAHKGMRSSEYSAATLANALEAHTLTFWNPTEVVSTADINDVPGASVIKALTYAEATELSFFGSPVIHPQNMVPIMDKKIVLRLRSFGHIENEGTVIDEVKGR